MIEPDVIIIGGGPAGLAAATEAARSGYTVELVEQRESLGGAIHRQPIEGVS
ncbi:MAG: FAD-dependent oxidoreductase, partial [Rhizobium sp.]|nr:FAD-dependent oxidoreductase [Rhizobium sp.]